MAKESQTNDRSCLPRLCILNSSYHANIVRIRGQNVSMKIDKRKTDRDMLRYLSLNMNGLVYIMLRKCPMIQSSQSDEISGQVTREIEHNL